MDPKTPDPATFAKGFKVHPADKQLALRLRKIDKGAKTQAQAIDIAKTKLEETLPHYEAELNNDINKLYQLTGLLERDPSATPTTVKSIIRVAHDLKGQGKTYGYDLISALAVSICDCCAVLDTTSPKFRSALQKHMEAITSISERGIKGKGSAVEQETLHSLKETISSARAKN